MSSDWVAAVLGLEKPPNNEQDIWSRWPEQKKKEIIFLDCNASHFALKLCSCIFPVLSFPTCVRLLSLFHCIAGSIIFITELIVSDCKNCLKVGLIFSSIKLKTVCQYLLNPKMDITTTQEILLFRLMLCANVLFYEHIYVIEFFIDLIFCVSNMCSNSLITMFVWNGNRLFLGVCEAIFRFLCNRFHRLFCCIHWLLMMILYWINTLIYNYHYC